MGSGCSAIQMDRAKTTLFVIFAASLAYSAGVSAFTDAFIDARDAREDT